jgi:hypothetical protein
MIEKRLRDGGVAYYWNPPSRDIVAGFSLHRQALGRDYLAAVQHAAALNLHLHDWRAGREAKRDIDHDDRFATVEWLGEVYLRSDAFNESVAARSKPEYRRAIRLVCDCATKDGRRVGDHKMETISARGVDKIYKALKEGKRGPRLRQANVCIMRMAKAWDVVGRLYPKAVPAENPFRGVGLKHGKGKLRHASRAEAYALHRALVVAGEPHLAVVPLVAFEWHQRPENTISGFLTWPDWRPRGQPIVHVVHNKNQTAVDMPLSDASGSFFPEISAYLDRLERIGVPIVLMRPKRRGAAARPFTQREARKRVRLAANTAGLRTDLTLAACRHGGLTEIGDAGVTEQEGMAASGHSTPEAHRGYVRHTALQRLKALRKRRTHVEREHTEDKSQNRAPTNESEHNG